jgi:hypothetical protein
MRNHTAIATKRMGENKGEDVIIKLLQKKLEMTPPGRTIHWGRTQDSTKSPKVHAPTDLLTLLWLLRYCIHDSDSLHKLKQYFAPDTFPSLALLSIKFLTTYIIHPIMNISNIHVNQKGAFLNNKIREDYISSNDGSLFPKISEFILYSTASEFIKIMVHHGEDPVFRKSNEHTKIINLILNGQHSYGPTGSTFDFYHAWNLYEFFFSAVPDLISYFQEEYSNLLLYNFKPATSHRTQSDFGPNTSMKNFAFCLPVKNLDGIYKPVSLFDFFNCILDGKEDALQPFIDLLDQERNKLLETSLTDNQKSQSSSTENDNDNEDNNEDSSNGNDDEDPPTKKN